MTMFYQIYFYAQKRHFEFLMPLKQALKSDALGGCLFRLVEAPPLALR